jgi:hypothetical protein
VATRANWKERWGQIMPAITFTCSSLVIVFGKWYWGLNSCATFEPQPRFILPWLYLG